MIEYEVDIGLNDAVKTLLTERKLPEFKILTDRGIKIKSFLKVTTNNDGEHKPCKGCPTKVQKVSDLHRAAGIDADYILLVDYYAWNHPKGLDPVITQEAFLHHALKSIKVEVKDGKVMKGKSEPDLQEYADTMRRYPSTLADYNDLLSPALDYSARMALSAGPAGTEEVAEEAAPEQEDQPPQRVGRGGRK